MDEKGVRRKEGGRRREGGRGEEGRREGGKGRKQMRVFPTSMTAQGKGTSCVYKTAKPS